MTETLEQLPQGSFGLTIRISVFSLSHNLDYYIFIYRQRPRVIFFILGQVEVHAFCQALTSLIIISLTSNYLFPCGSLYLEALAHCPFSYLIYLTYWQNQSYSMVQSSVGVLFLKTDQLTFLGVSWSHIIVLYSYPPLIPITKFLSNARI